MLYSFLSQVVQTLTGEQVLVLSLVSMLILQFLKIIWVGLLKQPKPSVGVMRWVLAGVGILFGVFWTPITLPPLDDPMAFIIALVTVGGEVVIFAGLVYDYMFESIVGWLDAAVINRRLLAP